MKTPPASFYGKSSENEIDLVLEHPNNQIWSAEFKRSQAPKFSKGYRIASEEFSSQRNFIISPGDDQNRLAENTELIGSEKFLNLVGGKARLGIFTIRSRGVGRRVITTKDTIHTKFLPFVFKPERRENYSSIFGVFRIFRG